ncbi:cytosolic phospholipase A2 isoform X2 [Nematostella vectensis]|nr:cytosolic phospholipase A2 isoform X2 [Nematostella vectensis]
MEITLMESDLVSDDILDKHTFRLNDLERETRVEQTFKFAETSKVDVEMELCSCPDPSDLRYSIELCDEEMNYLIKRREFVYETMREVLGDRGPKNINEVPTIAVLGSGGGFRAMTAFSGVFCALKDTKILDCATYTAGLSGSAWYLSCLYSHPEWPSIHPRQIVEELRGNVGQKWTRRLVQPSWMYKHMQTISKKRENGQPVSFTDFFGHLVADTIIAGREESKLSEQKDKVAHGAVPLPLYTCVHVKKDVSAHAFCEWLEFTPYEVGFPKYGTFVRSELFGSKFFCGKLMKKFDESTLQYLQGLWGSAFTILLQRVVKDGLKEPDETVSSVQNRGDLRNELEEMIASEEDDHNEDSDDEQASDSDEKDAAKNSNGDDDKEQSKLMEIVEKVIDRFDVFKTRQGRAGLVHNFLRGLQIAPSPDDVDAVAYQQLVSEDKRIFLVDSGLVFNSPYPPLLRPERGVDLYLSFDFSARDKDEEFPFKELLLAEEWAKKNNLPFPPINAHEQYETAGLKECYVFRHPSDPACPVVMHFVLVNKSFREHSKPGVLRLTEADKLQAEFSIFEDPKGPYSTFNFHYPNEPFDRLTSLTEYNTLMCERLIKDVMAECIQRRRDKINPRGRGRVGKCVLQ